MVLDPNFSVWCIRGVNGSVRRELTSKYGDASIIQAVANIRSIMGLENIDIRLNDPSGTKYACFCLGVRTRGTGSNTVLGGFNGVPAI